VVLTFLAEFQLVKFLISTFKYFFSAPVSRNQKKLAMFIAGFITGGTDAN
jgi:hypothetical protein